MRVLETDLQATRAAWEKSYLRELPDEIRDLLLSDAHPVTIPAGSPIYEAYGPPKLALIRLGLARVKIVSVEGRSATIRYAGPGQIIGLPSAVSNGSPVGAEAVTDCEASMLNVSVVQRLGQTNARLAWLLARQVADICFEISDVLGTNLFGTVRQRVARHLLDLATKGGDGLVVEVEQQEIADAIGSVREVVARTLRSLRDEGLLVRSRRGLELVDPGRLHAIAAESAQSGPTGRR